MFFCLNKKNFRTSVGFRIIWLPFSIHIKAVEINNSCFLDVFRPSGIRLAVKFAIILGNLQYNCFCFRADVVHYLISYVVAHLIP